MSESISSIYPETRTPKPIGVGDVFRYDSLRGEVVDTFDTCCDPDVGDIEEIEE